jgi:hypothetical protein
MEFVVVILAILALAYTQVKIEDSERAKIRQKIISKPKPTL